MVSLAAVTLGIVEEAYEAVREAMGSHLGPRNYDEVALISRDEMAAKRMINSGMGEGLFRHFRSSEDTVQPYYLGEPVAQYRVIYRFLQQPEKSYRIEFMSIFEGESPAHTPILEGLTGLNPTAVVHVSYKPIVPGLDGYLAECKVLKRSGLSRIQECSSCYGSFSYWTHPELPRLYLKPRVNLRDNPLQRITEEQFLTSKERARYGVNS